MSSLIYESILKAMRTNPKPSAPYGSIFETLRRIPDTSAPSTPFSSILKSLILNSNAPAADATPYASILSLLAIKPKVFVSYHHLGDRPYYDQFARVFAGTYECHDNSVDREIDSNDSEYVSMSRFRGRVSGWASAIVKAGAGAMVQATLTIAEVEQ